MKTEFKNATLKIWFTASSRSRNLFGVTETDRNGDTLRVVTNNDVVLLNWNNINLIEVLEDLK